MTAFSFLVLPPQTKPPVPDASDFEVADGTTDNKYQVTLKASLEAKLTNVTTIKTRAGQASFTPVTLIEVADIPSFPHTFEPDFFVPPDVAIKTWYDFENATGISYMPDDTYLTVTVSNSGSDTFAPTYISLTSTSFTPSSTAAVTVAAVTTDGEPEGDLAVVSDASGLFYIDSNGFLICAPGAVAGQTYSITIRSSNSVDELERTFIIAAISSQAGTYVYTAKRAQMVAAHTTPHPVDDTNTFMGFDRPGEQYGYDTSNWTVQNVASADAMMSAINSTKTGFKHIQLDFDGISSSSIVAYGPTANSLTANPLHPCGYNRPANSGILVTPKPGRSPSLNGPLNIRGVNLIEFRYVESRARTHFNGGYSSTYPLMPSVAMQWCYNYDYNGPQPMDCWVFHSESCDYFDKDIGVTGHAQFFRHFNNFHAGHKPNDIWAQRRNANSNIDLTNPREDTHIWWRGNIVGNCTDTPPESGEHFDMMQYGGGTGTYHMGGYQFLVEENRLGASGTVHRGSQGAPFGRDNFQKCEGVVINNISFITGNHAATIHDPSGQGDWYIWHNHFLKSGKSSSPGNNSPWINISNISGSQPGANGGDINIQRNLMSGIRGVGGSSYGAKSWMTIQNNIETTSQYGSLMAGAFGSNWEIPNFLTKDRATLKNSYDSYFRPTGGWNPNYWGASNPATWATYPAAAS